VRRAAVDEHLGDDDREPVAEHVETETAERNDRPEPEIAQATWRARDATLIIANWSASTTTPSLLLDPRENGVKFGHVDLPEIHTMPIGVTAIVTQHERKMISARKKAGRARSPNLATASAWVAAITAQTLKRW